MSYSKSGRLMQFLTTRPDGITARDAALALGWTHASTATILSRLSLYRQVDREMTGHRKGSLLPRYLYKTLPSAPPVAPLVPGSTAERNARRAATADGARAPMAKTMALLEELKRHHDGITSVALSAILGRNVAGQMSKLYAYGVIDRTRRPCRQPKTWEYLYRSKLPRVHAPASAAASGDEAAFTVASEECNT